VKKDLFLFILIEIKNQVLLSLMKDIGPELVKISPKYFEDFKKKTLEVLGSKRFIVIS